MIEFNPRESRIEHQKAFEEYLREKNPQFGAILAPLLRIDSLEQMSDADRRATRERVAKAVRDALNADSSS